MQSAFKIVAVAAVVAFAMAGCGVRGGLDAPQAAKDDATADANSGQGKPEGTADKPHKGFLLDGLLR